MTRQALATRPRTMRTAIAAARPMPTQIAVAMADSVTVVMVWRISEVSKPTSKPRAMTSCTR